MEALAGSGGSALRKPEPIRTVRRCNPSEWNTRDQCPAVSPAVDLAMTIGKAERGTGIVGDSGKIDPFGYIHSKGEDTVVQTDRILVQHDPQICWQRGDNIAAFPIGSPRLVSDMAVIVVKPRPIDRQDRGPGMPRPEIEAGANRPDGAVHRNRARGGNTAAVQSVGSLVNSRPPVRWTMKHAGIGLEKRRQQGPARVGQEVRIELVDLADPSHTRAPIMSGNSVSIVGIRRKEVHVFLGIHRQSRHELPMIIDALNGLAGSLGRRHCRHQEPNH